MDKSSATVCIIDDDTQVRASLANLLESTGLHVECFASTDDFLRVSRTSLPNCLLLDIRFPDAGPSGLDFQHQLAEAGVQVPIVFITGHGDVPMSTRAMKSGAVDFLLKPVREQDLLDAIRNAIDQSRRFNEQERMSGLLRERLASLSAREQEVMRLVVQGLRNKQIAAELGLSEVTVKVHRSHVMQKMQATSLAELVRISDRLNVLAVAVMPPSNKSQQTF